MMTHDRLSRAKDVARRLRDAGATQCLLVGGFVRDHLLGIESKDIDIEVYGLGYDRIIEILGAHFNVDVVGRSFGVLKVGHDIDVSIPRRESKIGVGHKGFDIQPDANMTPEQAAARRDFTVNAIAMTFDGEVVDPFDGRGDLERRILRATSSAFTEDPLRVLRGMQFAGRFGFEMDETTIRLCRGMIDEFPQLSTERIWEEWHKWATKSATPSAGLLLLEQTGWIDHFSILGRMRSTPQDPTWHPEGDVLIHTAHVCDAAALVAIRDQLPDRQRAVLMFAALCHDFGKPSTTSRNDDDRWTAPQHATVGVSLAEEFLTHIGAPGWLLAEVLPLVAEHMAHVGHPRDAAPSARVIRKLATRLAPATVRQWAAICEADASGRPPLPKRNPVTLWVNVAEELAVNDEQPQPILMGRHLMGLGMQPGPEMGSVLKQAFAAQLDGEFDSVDGAMDWAQRHDCV